jgi:dsDNA-binding SOS-regulon protein
MKLQNELKDVYDRSLWLVTAVESLLNKVQRTEVKDSEQRVERMALYITQMKESLGLMNRKPRQGFNFARNSNSPNCGLERVSVAPVDKRILKQSVMESHRKLMQSRAGRSVINSDLRTESSSPYKSRSFDLDSSKEAVLPRYNLLTGKIERLV